MSDLVQKLVGALEGAYALAIGHASTYKFQRGLGEFHPTHQKVLDDAQAALSEAKAGGWQPIETAPKDGQCLLWVDTDDGGEVMKLPRDSDGNWLYESEPTFTHSFYLKPTHWQPLPAPPAQRGEG